MVPGTDVSSTKKVALLHRSFSALFSTFAEKNGNIFKNRADSFNAHRGAYGSERFLDKIRKDEAVPYGAS